MNIDNITTPRAPRCWVVLDLESAVLDDTAHKRYQTMERWVPSADKPSRRGYLRSEDPLTCPRWIFQTVTSASAMVLIEHIDGGADVLAFETFSAPDLDERGVVAGLLKLLGDAPPNAELASYAGSAHDIPMLVLAACRLGLTIPPRWRWMAYNCGDPKRHFDFARHVTGGLRMNLVHMAEIAAALDIPAKISVPAAAVAKLIKAGRWGDVVEAVEGDVITLALLLARWRKLSDIDADPVIVEDRILRRIIELRPGRGYVAALEMHRHRRFSAQYATAANDAKTLAPWLDQDAA